MNPHSTMNVLIEAATLWALENPSHEVTFAVMHVHGHPTGATVKVEQRRREAFVEVTRPLSVYHAKYEAQCLTLAMDHAKQAILMGYGAPHEGARLEPVGERRES